MRTLPLRYLLASAAVNLLALALAFGVGVWGWFSARVLVVGCLVTFTVPMTILVAFAALVIDPTRVEDAFVTRGKDVPTAGRRVVLAVLPFLVFGGAALVALHVLWNSPVFRAWTVRTLGNNGLATAAENGLFDIDVRVQRSACEAYRDAGLPPNEERLAMALSDAADADFVTCLLAAMPPARHAHFEGVLTFKVNAWREQLIHEPVTAERACETAEWIRSTERLGHRDAPADLLTCAVAASDELTRVCCAQALRASARGLSVVQSLPAPERLASRSWANARAPELVLATRPGGLPQAVEEHASWATDESRTWALHFGCASMRATHGPDRYAIGDAMREMLANEGRCALPPVKESTYGIWDHACSTALSREHDDPKRLFCDELRGALLDDAVTTTRLNVMRAHRHASHPLQAARLERALLDYSRVPPGGFTTGTKSGQRARQIFEHLDILELLQSQMGTEGQAFQNEIENALKSRSH